MGHGGFRLRRRPRPSGRRPGRPWRWLWPAGAVSVFEPKIQRSALPGSTLPCPGLGGEHDGVPDLTFRYVVEPRAGEFEDRRAAHRLRPRPLPEGGATAPPGASRHGPDADPRGRGGRGESAAGSSKLKMGRALPCTPRRILWRPARTSSTSASSAGDCTPPSALRAAMARAHTLCFEWVLPLAQSRRQQTPPGNWRSVSDLRGGRGCLPCSVCLPLAEHRRVAGLCRRGLAPDREPDHGSGRERQPSSARRCWTAAATTRSAVGSSVFSPPQVAHCAEGQISVTVATAPHARMW